MIKYIMIHHTAVSHKDNSNQFEANNRYHKRRWSNFKSSMGYHLGYNYEISASGKVKQARRDGEQTAACYQAGMNDGRCIHIALDGNFGIEKPTEKQLWSLKELLIALTESYKIPAKNIVMHRDYVSTQCPGNYLFDNRKIILDLLEVEELEKEMTIILPEDLMAGTYKLIKT